MVERYKLFPASAAMLLLIPSLRAQIPVINSVTPVATTVERYGKFEATVDLQATYTNPYDYGEIAVKAIFTGPGGQSKTIDGFFIQDYAFTNPQTGAIALSGPGVFKIRFAPTEPGTWSYTVSCTTAAGTGVFPAQTLQCTAVTSTGNHGFVRGGQTNYLHFDDGTQYVPVGENMAWQQNNIFQNYTNWMQDLRSHGGNYFRLWQTHWGLGLEWKDNGYPGLKRYKQDNAFYLDWMFDYCAGNGLYVMWCQQHHGQVSSNVNPNWNENPYNAANGGPAVNTWDFFTHATAKTLTKNRFRYAIARWGYARSIMAWELFNEVVWTDQFAQHQAEIAGWHGEMAAYFKQHDPNGHQVTTSYAEDLTDPATWNLPDIDFTQTHFYINTPNIERVLAGGVRAHLGAFDKPTLTGEFGLSVSGAGLSAIDPGGIHLHNSLWAPLFAGGLGTAMTWWWDSYVEPQNLYHHFEAVADVTSFLPLHSRDFRPASSMVTGAGAELTITPVISAWGGLADTLLTITTAGTVTPAGAQLSQFLYGSTWNTQFRRPPVFQVNYPAAGPFTVQTNGNTGQNPKIAIWLDGVKVFEQNAQINQSYTINVPAGAHTIKVDNTGTDWIGIAAYVFAGLGSAVDAYVLKSADSKQIAGWALNNRYNHDYIGAHGLPPAAQGALLTVPGVANGSYLAKYYDCLTGAFLAQEALTATNDQLTFVLPDLLWDVAFVVDDQSVGVVSAPRTLPMRVYPNPVTSGPINVSVDLSARTPATLTLLDESGRTLRTLFSGELPAGEQTVPAMVPGDLPGGVYWIKMQLAGQVGTQAILLARP